MVDDHLRITLIGHSDVAKLTFIDICIFCCIVVELPSFETISVNHVACCAITSAGFCDETQNTHV